MAKSANSKVVFVPMQLQNDVMGQLTSSSNQYASTSVSALRDETGEGANAADTARRYQGNRMR